MQVNKYPVPHAQVAARIIDDQAVVVLADSGEVNVFNAVGTRIWELVDGTRTVQQIADAIHSEYEVTPEEAQRDVEEFIGKLIEANAITLLDQPKAQ
jgi:Coenzyme PQQ synthesis protein D (PqqD)